MQPTEWGLCAGALVVAFLYSSVGHAGASGYIAVMALAGISSATIKPTALVLNVIVATIGTAQFWRAGHFRWSLFWPLAVTSIPAAYFGGKLVLPTRALNVLLGIVLLASAVNLLIRLQPASETRLPGKPVAILSGGALGFLAGLTGTGGGIFLTPLMILLRWASTKQAAAVSAFYILVNSVAGLLGVTNAWWRSTELSFLDFVSELPRRSWSLVDQHVPFLIPMIVCVTFGGLIGATLGSRRFSVPVIHVLLSAVLMMAGGKLILAQPAAAIVPSPSATR